MSGNYAAWKALERRHAKRFCDGVRLWRPDFSDSQPDGEAARDVWDTKAYAVFSVVGLFRECELKYRAYSNGRRFHLCLFSRRHRGAGDFVLCRASDFADLVETERKYLEQHSND